MKNSNVLQMLKFTAFSISAGVIQILSELLFLELLHLPESISYFIGLALSVIWNFTLNRKFTFKSAANIPIAMLKVAGFYLVFTPLSTLFVHWAEGFMPSLIPSLISMLLNFVLEFLFCKFIVYRGQENTAQK